MRQPYWWIVTFTEQGRLVVLGPYESETEANRLGVSKLAGNFQVIELQTADQAKATKIIKYNLFKESNDLERALQKARHQI